MALRRSKVLGVPERREAPRGAEAGGRDGRPGARAGPLLPACVQRHGLEEAPREERVASDEFIEDRDGARDAALPAYLGRLEAEQAHDVGRVAVEVDVACRAVAANERVGRLLAVVHDVAEEFVRRVLGAGHAEVVPEAPVGARGAIGAPAFHREAAHHDEAAAAGQGVRPALDPRGQRRQRKAAAVDLLQRKVAGGVRRRFQLRDLLGAQAFEPVFLTSAQVRAPPGGRRVHGARGYALVRTVEVVPRLGAEGAVAGHGSRRSR